MQSVVEAVTMFCVRPRVFCRQHTRTTVSVAVLGGPWWWMREFNGSIRFPMARKSGLFAVSGHRNLHSCRHTQVCNKYTRRRSNGITTQIRSRWHRSLCIHTWKRMTLSCKSNWANYYCRRAMVTEYTRRRDISHIVTPDRRSQISVHNDERTQVHSARSSLVVTPLGPFVACAVRVLTALYIRYFIPRPFMV